MKLSLSANISKLRKEHAMTQEQLADRMNMNQSALSQWETGVSAPRADKLPELAKILGCTIDELFTEKGGEDK